MSCSILWVSFICLHVIKTHLSKNLTPQPCQTDLQCLFYSVKHENAPFWSYLAIIINGSILYFGRISAATKKNQELKVFAQTSWCGLQHINQTRSESRNNDWLVVFWVSCAPYWLWLHRFELPGNYPVFTVVMGIYHYVERIWIILVTPIFLYNIYDH